jgi:hypothetical protein
MTYRTTRAAACADEHMQVLGRSLTASPVLGYRWLYRLEKIEKWFY